MDFVRTEAAHTREDATRWFRWCGIRGSGFYKRARAKNDISGCHQARKLREEEGTRSNIWAPREKKMEEQAVMDRKERRRRGGGVAKDCEKKRMQGTAGNQ